MKNIFVFCLFILILCTQGCKKDNVKPIADQVTDILTSSNWKIQNVTVDGVDHTSSFQGMTLSFTKTNYTATHGKVVWPATGTWKFTSQEAKSIERNDDIIVTISEATHDKLVLSFNWNKETIGTGRSASIKGSYSFTFTK